MSQKLFGDWINGLGERSKCLPFVVACLPSISFLGGRERREEGWRDWGLGHGTAYLDLQMKVKGKEGRGMSALSIGSPG